ERPCFFRTLPLDADYPWSSRDNRIYGSRESTSPMHDEEREAIDLEPIATARTPAIAKFVVEVANAAYTDRKIIYLAAPANDK
ncbi:MAG: hypothetical protein OEZ03_15600, partial [Alphaproteobacteria bacterium]|nr:hypothetical protein [Alphaproteobacteria bacterium]